MRYAVISDVHSNVVALEAVLDNLSGAGIDRFLCLGDIVGYGPRPNQCCDLIRDLDCLCIKGNHDEAAVDIDKAEWFTAPARACTLLMIQARTPSGCFGGRLDSATSTSPFGST